MTRINIRYVHPHADYICISQILKLFQFVTCIAGIFNVQNVVREFAALFQGEP